MKQDCCTKMRLHSIAYLVSGILLAATLSYGSNAHAISSVNVPLDNWAYGAIEKLSGFGLIFSDIQGTRPFTRMEVARLVHEALQEQEKRQEKTPSLVEYFFDKFKKEYREELEVWSVGRSIHERAYLKPIDEVQARYVYVDGKPREFKGYETSGPKLDATEGTPMVYNNEGVVYGENHNFSFQFSTVLGYKDFFSAYVQPIVLFSENRGNLDNVDDASIDLLKGYGKLSLCNVDIQFGRDSMWWGRARHGEMILTNNAVPLDMVKVTNSTPSLLPWYFSYLGPFKYTFFLSRLEDFTVNALVEGQGRVLRQTEVGFGGVRLNFKPTPNIEIGMSNTFIFGGEGIPSLTIGDIFLLFGFQGASSSQKANQLAALDFRFKLPFLRNAELYGEYAGEDSGGLEYWEELILGDVGYLVGIYFPRLTDDGRTDLRVEYANNSHRVDSTPGVWYGNAIFRSGYTHDRMIMGHHMDGDAEDLFVRVTRYLRNDLVVGLDYDFMQRGKSLNPVQEKVNQVGGDITFDVTRSLSVMGRYTFESVENYNLKSGVDRHNHLFMTALKYTF